jgi:hypothetical protein
LPQNDLPPHVASAVRRILDREAARLLAEQLPRDVAVELHHPHDEPEDLAA